MRISRRVLLAIVCLSGTGASVGWAEPAHVDRIGDPYAPHVTRGSTARLGTAVGFLYGEPFEVVAIGGTTALGVRLDRLTLEAELGVLSLQAKDGTGLRLGDAERLGALARFDVLRLDSRWVGANTMIAIYAEGGAAVAWNHWYRPGIRADERIVPADSKRVEGQAGFGLLIDHRLSEPLGAMRRFGWFLGWRFALTRHDRQPTTICRATSCRLAPRMPDDDRLIDRSMLFQSSLAVTW